MGVVITFQDYQPTPRYDGIEWTTARIEESVAQPGPWDLLEVKPIPDYPDATDPPIMSFTTELATLEEGWYRIVFVDATNDVQQPTQPIHNSEQPIEQYRPAISDIGALMRARTKDTGGVERGTFTSDTRPTDDEVAAIITIASYNVGLILGNTVTSIPAELSTETSMAIAYRTAMLIELSYWPEQVARRISPYHEYKTLYDEKIAAVLAASSEIEGGGEVGPDAQGNEPVWSYPPPQVMIW